MSMPSDENQSYQKIFGSYAFQRVLAHYCEQMLLDEGFGKDKGDLTALKYRLAQLDESLFRYCRLCVSIMMHTQGMTVEEGTKSLWIIVTIGKSSLLLPEAMRGTNDPGYLNYNLGKAYDFKSQRDDYKSRKEAITFTKISMMKCLSTVHRRCLLLREIMLKDKLSGMKFYNKGR